MLLMWLKKQLTKLVAAQMLWVALRLLGFYVRVCPIVTYLRPIFTFTGNGEFVHELDSIIVFLPNPNSGASVFKINFWFSENILHVLLCVFRSSLILLSLSLVMIISNIDPINRTVVSNTLLKLKHFLLNKYNKDLI